MKKAFLFLASTALLLAGCAKVEKEEIVPTPESGKRIVTLNAGVDNSGTRVSVDESTGNYSWQAGEEISVLINNNKLTKSEAQNVSGNSAKFQVELESGESIGDYAYSPADATWWNASNSIGLAASHDYVEGATFMPMLGTVSADKKSISFKAVGGVIKLTISNIPSNAESLVFSAYGKRITGTFAISDEKITAENQTGNDDVTVNFAGKQSSTMAFFIPLPTGTYSGFELQFYAAGNTAIAGAGKKVEFGSPGLSVSRSEVIVAPELPLTKYYTKVTSNEELGDGYYLIVYEDGSVAFNGGLTALDVASNTIGVTITNNLIPSNATTDAARFYISFDESRKATIQSESGNYIGLSSDGNGLNSSTDEQINTISIDEGNATIVSSGGAYLRYNATSGQERFRYYKSSTYSNQKAIALYFIEATTKKTSISTGSENATISAGNHSASINRVRLINPQDDQGIIATVDVDWLTVAFEGGNWNDGRTLKATATSYNHSTVPRTATVTLTATGATKTVTFVQNPSVVTDPTELTAIPGNKTFEVSWANNTKVASYVAYYSNSALSNPTSGIALTPTREGDTWKVIPTDELVNDNTYYVYVKAATLTSSYADKYIISDDWASAEVMPEDPDAKTIISIDFYSEALRPSGFPYDNDHSGQYLSTYRIAGYDFSFYAKTKFYWIINGKNTYLLLGKKGSYILLPAIENKKLTKVKFATQTGSSSSVIPDIYNATGSASLDVNNSAIPAGSTIEWQLSGTSNNTSYQFRITSDHNIQLTSLELTYE